MLLPRSIKLEVGRSTWPRGKFPTQFTNLPAEETVDVATVLNLIGVLTTPPLSGGASLSELWAFVRYLFAVTDGNDLRLTSDFQEMDPHQKTILSDDFGMGFSMHWLALKLDFFAVCDGRYFIENHLTQTGAVYTGGTARRGLGKSPDFVALDRQGLFHVVECKGTQSSIGYRNSQLRNQGVAQKRTISFPAHRAGERLAAGIFIAGPEGDPATLRVIDPEYPDPYVVREHEVDAAQRAVARGSLAKHLRSAGFPRTSAATAFPQRRPSIEALQVRGEDQEESFTRRMGAEEELKRYTQRIFKSGDRQIVGRRVELPLPRPLATKRGVYTKIELRQGLQRESFERVREGTAKGDPTEFEVETFAGDYRAGEQGGRAWISFGNSYFSDMRFLR